MVQFKQEADMVEDGSDSTATYHKVGGVPYMYVWLGRSGNNGSVVRYNLNDFTSEKVDEAPLAFNQGKVFKPDPENQPNKLYVTPRWYENDETPSINENEAVKIEVTSSGISYTVTETFTYAHHNPHFAVVDGTAYWWTGELKDTSDGSDQGINRNYYRVEPDTFTSTSVGTYSLDWFNGATGVLNGTVYQFGGLSYQTGGERTAEEIYEIDPPNGTENQVATTTFNGEAFGMRTHFGRFFGDFYYSFGGYTENGRSDNVWRIDPSDGAVEVFANMNQSMEDVITGFDGSRLWAFGGYDGGNYPDAYRIIRTKSDRVLMVKKELCLRGVFPQQGDEAVLHDKEDARAELAQSEGNEVVMIEDGLAQG